MVLIKNTIRCGADSTKSMCKFFGFMVWYLHTVGKICKRQKFIRNVKCCRIKINIMLTFKTDSEYFVSLEKFKISTQQVLI